MKSIEKIKTKALVDCDISHEEFQLVINDKNNFLKLTKSMKTKDSQLGNIKRKRLTESSKR